MNGSMIAARLELALHLFKVGKGVTYYFSRKTQHLCPGGPFFGFGPLIEFGWKEGDHAFCSNFVPTAVCLLVNGTFKRCMQTPLTTTGLVVKKKYLHDTYD